MIDKLVSPFSVKDLKDIVFEISTQIPVSESVDFLIGGSSAALLCAELRGFQDKAIFRKANDIDCFARGLTRLINIGGFPLGSLVREPTPFDLSSGTDHVRPFSCQDGYPHFYRFSELNTNRNSGLTTYVLKEGPLALMKIYSANSILWRTRNEANTDYIESDRIRAEREISFKKSITDLTLLCSAIDVTSAAKLENIYHEYNSMKYKPVETKDFKAIWSHVEERSLALANNPYSPASVTRLRVCDRLEC